MRYIARGLRFSRLWTKSSDVSAGSSSPCVSSVSRSTISKPFVHPTQSFVFRKWMELDWSGI